MSDLKDPATTILEFLKIFESRPESRYMNKIEGNAPSATSPSAMLLSLRGGSAANEGNVYVNGRPICDDEWDANAL